MENEERKGLTVKDILIRLILVIIFIFLLIWLFPMPNLKPLNNQIFADNVDRMKDVAKSYYTLERLPSNINDSKRMTLKEMINSKLILPLMDSNGKYCSTKDSYIEITKLENEYVIKVNLSCSDKTDYIIEHFGCYDICSNECKLLDEALTTTKKTTTKKNSTKVSSDLYEYEFLKNTCTQAFEQYVCPTGYYLVGDSCIKNSSETIVKNATKKVTTTSTTDKKDAEAVVNSSSEIVGKTCTNKNVTSTINASTDTTVYSALATTTTQKITADKINSYDVKGAVGTVTVTNANYITVQNYRVITADKIISSYNWTYDYTKIATEANLAYENATEKLVYVDTFSEPTCSTCATMVVYYKYYHYVKEAGNYTYSCDAYPGYSLYDGNKCRIATTTSKSCPSGYTANGSVCTKQSVSYSCSAYGSDYVLDSSNNTCKKTTTSYSCPSGTTQTSDPKYCAKSTTTYSCPAGTTSIGNNKCSKTSYYCPSNTSDKTYTLVGNKCSVITKTQSCTCPSGSTEATDGTCVKKTSSTTYTCSSYPGYTLSGKTCSKTTTTDHVSYVCDSGYELNANNNTCIKTVSTSDTKKATAKYKTSCTKSYMWSTKTSVDGWIYTGNKRKIN